MDVNTGCIARVLGNGEVISETERTSEEDHAPTSPGSNREVGREWVVNAWELRL